jgi:hypothetical protein
MPDYAEACAGLKNAQQFELRRTQMAILTLIKKLVTEFVAPAGPHDTPDTVAYHAQPDDRELRFSPSSALRRHY